MNIQIHLWKPRVPDPPIGLWKGTSAVGLGFGHYFQIMVTWR